jgi:hypothetical protein
MTEGRSGLILHYGSQRLGGKGSRPILNRLPQAIKPDFQSIVIGNDNQTGFAQNLVSVFQ